MGEVLVQKRIEVVQEATTSAEEMVRCAIRLRSIGECTGISSYDVDAALRDLESATTPQHPFEDRPLVAKRCVSGIDGDTGDPYHFYT